MFRVIIFVPPHSRIGSGLFEDGDGIILQVVSEDKPWQSDFPV